VSPSGLYWASPIKRKRRSRDEVYSLFNAVVDILDEYRGEPITIRHLFYRLVSRGVLEKDEKAYKNLCAYLSKWRKAGHLQFDHFVDGTRWYHGITGFNDAAEALDDAIAAYRKNLWKSQKYYVEVWCEKDAILSLIMPLVQQWTLKAFPCRGFTSLSSTFAAAKTFKDAIERGRRPVILYLGDHDPSGLAIDDSIEDSFGYYDIDGMVDFRRVAILRHHIVDFKLPTRPVKKTDSRSKGWEGGCVEIDTLSGQQIRDLLNKEVESLVDPEEYQRLKDIEEAEREMLAEMPDLFRDKWEASGDS
jgi:hypothetical protein